MTIVERGKTMALDHQVLLFEQGIKPALLVGGFNSLRRGETTKRAEYLDERLSKYPKISFSHRGNKLYFQNEQARKQFLSVGITTTTIGGVDYRDYSRWYLGIALGFPPSAVDFFCGLPDELWKKTDKTFIDYYGIAFTCRREDVDNCLLWCNEHYLIPTELKMSLPYKVEDMVHKS